MELISSTHVLFTAYSSYISLANLDSYNSRSIVACTKAHIVDAFRLWNTNQCFKAFDGLEVIESLLDARLERTDEPGDVDMYGFMNIRYSLRLIYACYAFRQNLKHTRNKVASFRMLKAELYRDRHLTSLVMLFASQLS